LHGPSGQGRLNLPALVIDDAEVSARHKPGVLGFEFESIVIGSRGKPFQLGMRKEMGRRTERNEVARSDLWTLDIADHLSSQFLVFKTAIYELNDLAGNVGLEIPSQIQIHRANGGEHDSPDDGPLDAIIQKPFPYPATVSELLSHCSPI